MHRHHFAERAAGNAAAGADAFEQIQPAGMRLRGRVGTHPAQNLLGVGQVSENGGAWGGDLGLASHYERFGHRRSSWADVGTWRRASGPSRIARDKDRLRSS